MCIHFRVALQLWLTWFELPVQEESLPRSRLEVQWSRRQRLWLSAVRAGSKPEQLRIPQDASCDPAVKVPIIILWDDEGVSESAWSVLMAFAYIQLRVAKGRDWPIPSQLSNVLANTCSDMINLKKYIKIPTYCEDVTTRSIWGLMKDDGFSIVLLRGIIAKKKDCGTLYMKNLTDGLCW